MSSIRESDPVHHPAHYTSHKSGVECVDVVEHLPFNVGCAVKYLFRMPHKGRSEEDLRKAAWYLHREFARMVHPDAYDRVDIGVLPPRVVASWERIMSCETGVFRDVLSLLKSGGFCFPVHIMAAARRVDFEIERLQKERGHE